MSTVQRKAAATLHRAGTLPGFRLKTHVVNWCCQQVLKREQEEYRSEGITWTDVKFFNNRIICELIEGQRTGILGILDEKCLMVGQTYAASCVIGPDKL